MEKTIIKAEKRFRRKHSIRKRVNGSSDRPRLSVYRSAKHIYVQIIDDSKGVTLLSTSSLVQKINGGNIIGAKAVGEQIAKEAIAAGITKVVFDRNGFLYHGRIKVLADAARESGLQF